MGFRPGSPVGSVNGETGAVVLDAIDVGAQPADSDLAAIAALLTTPFGRGLLTLADAAAGRAALGLGTAATQNTTAFEVAGAAAAAQAASQPLDADLTAIATLATTTYGRSLLALADAAAGRSVLGLGSAATSAASAFDTAGAAAAAQAASQPVDSDLTAIAALLTTAFGRGLLTLADAAAARTTFGLGNVDNTSDAAKPVSTAQQAALDTKVPVQNPWAPTGSVAVVGGGRAMTLGSQSVLTSGTLRLVGELVLPKGQAINGITIVSGAQAAVTPANQWFCLVAQTGLGVLRKTTDDLTTPWAAGTPKPLALASSYTPAADESVYLGIVVVAGTPPSIVGWSVGFSTVAGIAPVLGGNSTTGLTNPASLGATAATPTAASQMFWGFVSA